MRSRPSGTILFVLAVLTASGCSQTRYVEMPPDQPAAESASSISRTVEFRLDDLLLTQPPRCLLIVGRDRERVAPELAGLIEQSLTRHLLQRMPRVISGAQREQQARYHGFPVADGANARRLAGKLGCDGLLEYEVVDAEAHYLLFYTRLSMKLDVRAIRLSDGAELWRARHATTKSSGGPPTSLASVVSIWSATELAGDDEAAAGLVEEIVRRIMATWPIVKRPA